MMPYLVYQPPMLTGATATASHPGPRWAFLSQKLPAGLNPLRQEVSNDDPARIGQLLEATSVIEIQLELI